MNKNFEKVLNIILDKWYIPFKNRNDFPIVEITWEDWINNIVLIIYDLKDNFKSSSIISSEWDYYEFPWFNASLPKEEWNAEDVVNAKKEFINEITKWFIKAQANAIYEDELEEFYDKLFWNNETENN